MGRLLSNNNVLRIIAVLLSIILWFSVQYPGQTNGAQASNTDRFPIAVKVEAPAGMVVTSVQPSTAAVVIHENAASLPQLSEQMLNVSLVADARKLGPGSHQIPLTALHMPLVNHTIAPAIVTVTLAKQATITHAVKVQLSGAPANGYSVGTPNVSVSTVRLSGAKSELNAVSQVLAEVDVQGATKDISEQVSLLAIDSNGQTVNGVAVSPATATVSIPISAPTSTSALTASLVGTPAAGYAVSSVTLSPSSVTVYGQGAQSTIQIPVDVSGLQTNKTEKVAVPLKSGNQNAEPNAVTASITVEASQSATLNGETIRTQNVASGRSVQFTGTSAVTIHVTGPQSVIKNLSSADVVPYIDLKGLKPGTHTVHIQVEVPAWVQVTQLSQVTTQVTIS